MSSGEMPGGSVAVAPDLRLGRMGFGTMQLTGQPGGMGEPRDRERALGVLRDVVELGVRHIDTADFYGPAVTNELIREALYPYPDDLVIVTKVGVVRGPDGSFDHSRDAAGVTAQVHRNLAQLDVEALDVVNFRVGGATGPVEAALPDGLEALIRLKEDGLIRHLGMSEVTMRQYDEARRATPLVCVQSNYNVAHRDAEALVRQCADEGIAFVPYFPLGGMEPLQSDALHAVAHRNGASVRQVALAWLLHHSPSIAVIPGTSSSDHLRENVAAVDLQLSAADLAVLDGIGAPQGVPGEAS